MVSSISAFCHFPEAKTLKAFYEVFVDDLQNPFSCKIITVYISAVLFSLIADNSIGATLITPEANKSHPVVLTREKWRDVVGT